MLIDTSFQEYGHKVAFYHGSMDPDLRASVQKAWSKDQINIICATVAFGMGMSQYFHLSVKRTRIILCHYFFRN